MARLLLLQAFVALVLFGTTVDAFSAASSTTASSKQQQLDSHNQIARLVSGQVAWNSLVGEADRAFTLGIQLEKNGQARKASAAFHEAATLYQCKYDSLESGEFGHVTQLPEQDCSTILAYTSLRLGFLNLDALGDAKAAARLYKTACQLEPVPSASSYDGLGTSLEASASSSSSGSANSLQQAVKAYQRAIELQPDNRRALFHLAVALERLGTTAENAAKGEELQQQAEEYLERLRRDEAVWACLVDSWGYVRWHTRKVPTEQLNLYRGTRDMLEIALQAAMPLIEQGGLVCEFGVGSGRSLRITQEILPLDTPLHGFDTFTGLPQPWAGEPAGAYSTGGAVPNMEGRAYFHKGLFRDTLGPFLEQAGPESFLAYANIDCDLYSSTLDVLESMHGKIIPGTVLVFDEYVGHPTWRQDEFRAWRESCKRCGWNYEYLAFSLSTKQAVVRVIGT